MIPKDFSDYFRESSPTQQQEIIDQLLQLSLEGGAVKDTSERKAVSCPYCQCKQLRGNGRLKGLQPYVCKACEKNFSETTGKFWFALKKKEKLNKYLYCLLSGYSICKSALETGISIQTSLYWRHKLLTSFSSVGR